MTENRKFKQTVRAFATQRSISYAMAHKHIKQRINNSTKLSIKEFGQVGKNLYKYSGNAGLILIGGAAYRGKTTVADSLGNALASKEILVHNLHPAPDYESFENHSKYNQYFYGEDYNFFESLLEKSLNLNPATIIIDDVRQPLPNKVFDTIRSGKLVIAVIESYSPEMTVKRFLDAHPYIDQNFMNKYFKGTIFIDRTTTGNKITVLVP